MNDQSYLKKRNVFIAILGNIIEWYDFSLFIFLAPVIAQNFFPPENLQVNLLYTFVIFAVGFFVRPLGSAVFGTMGDRIGRAATLRITMLLMSIPAMIMAVLPTYATWGVFSPILLCLCRITQGFAIGGEMVGTIVYLTESAPGHRRALVSSLANNGSNLGVILATGFCALLSALLPESFFSTLGWRLAFFVGAVVGFFGVWLRNTIQESAVFHKIRERQQQHSPLKITWKMRKRKILQLCLLLVMSSCGSYILIGYLSTYLHVYSHYSLAHALEIQTLFILITLFLVPGFAILADKIGRRVALASAALGYLVLAIPSFYLLQNQHNWIMLLPLLVIYCMEQATTPAAIVELFPSQARYTAISIGYNLNMALIGGTAPAILTWLIDRFHNPMIIAYYLAAAALISMSMVAFALPKTYGKEHELV